MYRIFESGRLLLRQAGQLRGSMHLQVQSAADVCLEQWFSTRVPQVYIQNPNLVYYYMHIV